MSKSTTANFLNITNLIASRERNMIINMIMSSHVAIVTAVDLLSGVIGVARTANDIEGIFMTMWKDKDVERPPSQTDPKEKKIIRQRKGNPGESKRCTHKPRKHVGRIADPGSRNQGKTGMRGG